MVIRTVFFTMTTGSQHIIYLLEKYARKEATSGEVNELLALLRTGDHDETVVAFIEQHVETLEPGDAEDITFWKERLAGGAQKITGTVAAANEAPAIDISTQVRPVHRVHFMRRWGWAAAAVILALYGGVYIWKMNAKEASRTDYAVDTKHIEPGKNGAILTLADGSKVVLDSLGNGIIATLSTTQVTLHNGQVMYNTTHPPLSIENELLNTMTTPKGRQFQLTLSDGTRVWLNAASSIRFPTAFTGRERRVMITGEAYFEVAHNKHMPFKVQVDGKAAIEVLGTHFNVNAYENEKATSTTLLEGSVKVGVSDSALLTPDSRLLKPGQQAQVVHRSNTGGAGVMVINNNVDVNKVMAWKNGLFNFEGASLGEVMRQIERWYDIEVAYEKGIPHIEFEGKMTKDVPLKDLLVMLEKSDIHFRIEDRKLIVLP
jgi:transmembrane sensor